MDGQKIPRSALKGDISKTKRVTALYSSQILVCYYSVKSIPIYNGCLFEAGLTRNQPPEKQVESSLFCNFYWLCDLLSPFFHQMISAHGWASGWILIVTSAFPSGKKPNCPPSKRHEFHCKFPMMGSFTDSPFTLEIGDFFLHLENWRNQSSPFWMESQPYGFHVFGCNPEEFFWIKNDDLGWWVSSKIFLCSPGEPWGFLIQFDDHIFQRGWFNHQLEWLYPSLGCFFRIVVSLFFLKRPKNWWWMIYIRWGTLAFVEPSRWWLGCWYHHQHHYHWI